MPFCYGTCDGLKGGLESIASLVDLSFSGVGKALKGGLEVLASLSGMFDGLWIRG
jgi:hypothetical protein